jgi:hypothetical protein
MYKVILWVFLFVFAWGSAAAQKITTKQLILGESALVVGGYLALNKAWYADYERTSFHFFNDNQEWLQQDKVGHMFASFHLQKLQTQALIRTGVSLKKARLWSAISVTATMASIEVLDGFSKQWGASFGDIFANTSGVLLACISDYYDNQLSVKYSYQASDYAKLRPALLGSGFERVLKDYNTQTYWLTVSPKALRFPVTLSLGHGVNGLLGGSNNPILNESGTVLPITPRERIWVLALDINHHYFKPKTKLGKAALWLAQVVKIPAPAIFMQGSCLKASWFYF